MSDPQNEVKQPELLPKREVNDDEMAQALLIISRLIYIGTIPNPFKREHWAMFFEIAVYDIAAILRDMQ